MAKNVSLLAATLATLCLCQSSAQALTNRAWVSGHGTDAAGCGSPASPCRSFQYVHDNVVAAGGEIDVLDPAGYGAVTITKAVSIVNDGVGAAGVQPGGGNAITINAGPTDKVALRGLSVDGLGAFVNGIVFNSGGGLTIANCVVRRFATPGGPPTQGNGVLIQPTSGTANILISNVIISDNDVVGLYFNPPSGAPNATFVIDRVTAVGNNYGIVLNNYQAGGGAVTATLSNSVANENSSDGVYIRAVAGSITAVLDNMNASSNGGNGVTTLDHATVTLGRSVISANVGAGVANTTSPDTVYSYGDNRINKNGTDISGAIGALTTQ